METDQDLSNALYQIVLTFADAAFELANHRRAPFDQALGEGLKQLDTFMDRKAASE